MAQLGKRLRLEIFGQSHGEAVGGVISGFPSGKRIDWPAAENFMARRAPGCGAFASQRKETDRLRIVSGLNENGETCGAPLCFLISNQDAHSSDYEALRPTPRPGHADYAAYCKLGEAWDYRGGGQFSGRLTAPICFAGALAMQLLREQGVQIGAHIARIGQVADAELDVNHPAFPLYSAGTFPVLDAAAGQRMQAAITEAKAAGDSLGGVIRCIISGLPAGWGDALFDGVESRLSVGLFGIPGVKGVEFGAGFAVAGMRGSENNDAFCLRDGCVETRTNHCGGILGGITNGMPVYFQVAVKPTPSISLPQTTINRDNKQETTLSVSGRHDSCIVPRAVPVVEAVAALVLADMLLEGA